MSEHTLDGGGHMKPLGIYDTGDREIHSCGTYVAVCWNLEQKEETHMDEKGRRCTLEYSVREGEPYIDFVCLRQGKDETWYEAEDTPVAGGLSARQAQTVAEELHRAMAYLAQLQKEPARMERTEE